MNKLNRKEYKKTIKEFRKNCPLSQIVHKWVYCKIYGRQTLMFVHGTIVKRANKKDLHERFHAFEYGGHKFVITLYGSPSLKSKHTGLTVLPYSPIYTTLTKDDYFKIIENEEEVEKIYDKIIEDYKKLLKFPFVAKKQ